MDRRILGTSINARAVTAGSYDMEHEGSDEMMIKPALDEILEVLDPYVVDRMPVDAPWWKNRVSELDKKWRRRTTRRRYFGWLPTGFGVPKWLRGKRTQPYIREMYEQAYAKSPTTDADVALRKPVAAEWHDEGLLVRRGALPRVAKKHVLLVEPFADFQTTELRRNFVYSKDYFSLPVDGLKAFGITPTFVTGEFPQNLRLGNGLVAGSL